MKQRIVQNIAMLLSKPKRTLSLKYNKNQSLLVSNQVIFSDKALGSQAINNLPIKQQAIHPSSVKPNGMRKVKGNKRLISQATTGNAPDLACTGKGRGNNSLSN